MSSTVTYRFGPSTAGVEAASRPTLRFQRIFPVRFARAVSQPSSASWKSIPRAMLGGNSSSSEAVRRHTRRKGGPTSPEGWNTRRCWFV